MAVVAQLSSPQRCLSSTIILLFMAARGKIMIMAFLFFPGPLVISDGVAGRHVTPMHFVQISVQINQLFPSTLSPF